MRILSKFKCRFLSCMPGVAAIIVAFLGMPYTRQIRHLSSMFPLAISVAWHFLLWVVLNPALMVLNR